MKMSRRLLITGAAATAALAQPVRFPRRVRVALLGLDGHTGEILNPLPSLPDAELVAFSDPNPEARERFRKRRAAAGARAYRDHRQMLDSEELDVVGVCGPNGGRAGWILECVNRGLHVAAEKPIALSRGELNRIRAAVERKQVRLTTLLPMRFSSPYLALKQVVDSGEIGEACQLAAQKSYKAGQRPLWMRRRESYGGTIPWIGIHMIDLMYWASGREFTEVYSLTSHIAFPQLGDMENVTASVFTLDNRGIGVLRMDYLRPPTAPSHGDDRLRIAGTKGVVEYQGATGVTVLSNSGPPRKLDKLPPKQSLFTDFLESVYNGKTHALPLEDIYRVNELTIAAQEAAERDQAVKC